MNNSKSFEENLPPKFQKALKDSAKGSLNIICFVGAGVSQNVRFKDNLKDTSKIHPFPSWQNLLIELAKSMVNGEAQEKILHHLNNRDLDYIEIAEDIQKILGDNEFRANLKKTFLIDKNLIDKESLSAQESIWKLTEEQNY